MRTALFFYLAWRRLFGVRPTLGADLRLRKGLFAANLAEELFNFSRF
jgi:hypothetical protein